MRPTNDGLEILQILLSFIIINELVDVAVSAGINAIAAVTAVVAGAVVPTSPKSRTSVTATHQCKLK